MRLTPENQRTFESLLQRYPVKRSALLPLLHLVQDQEGWLSREAIEHVASLLDLTPAQVHDTASFYTMFRLHPEGETQIEICTTLSCALRGAEALLDHTCQRLGVRPGGTSADGKFTVRGVECLAACGGAPAVQVNGEWLESATPADIDRVLAGERVRRRFEWPKSPGEHILFQNVWKEDSASIDTYRESGGYAKLAEWLALAPEAIIETVKRSNLRGRGGAGFPTGMKWGFLPKDSPKPRYLCVNADESEPGTYKDRVIIEKDPHRLIEGTIVSAHAIRCRTAYIYIRGEFHEGAAILEGALAEARAAGLVGKNILGSGVDIDIWVHRGAGSYECGEETALIESLEGKRGQPRIKPPFPAVVGLYDCPTIVNNVETLVNVPLILTRGAEWFAEYGVEKNGGPKLYSVSGHVNRPGSYEAPMGRVTLRELIYGEGYARGIRGGRRLKAVVPGGSSTPVFRADEIDVAMTFDAVAKAGSMLGSAGTIVMDDSTCMVWMAKNLMYFYKHESCGKCTPCREGTGWMLRLLDRIEAGLARESDLDLLWKVTDSIAGKTVCPFGDAAIAPPQSTLGKFREEFLYHVREKRCWKTVAPTFEEALALSVPARTA
ncbi:MAG TPA: NADH-quinone oxidoreductase subunit NuoF [Vicinamibacteria bacterium]|nr:NADH-quinone oxidoreductase subunit NuoF [Vicinamibacteria bacterium]